MATLSGQPPAIHWDIFRWLPPCSAVALCLTCPDLALLLPALQTWIDDQLEEAQRHLELLATGGFRVPMFRHPGEGYVGFDFHGPPFGVVDFLLRCGLSLQRPGRLAQFLRGAGLPHRAWFAPANRQLTESSRAWTDAVAWLVAHVRAQMWLPNEVAPAFPAGVRPWLGTWPQPGRRCAWYIVYVTVETVG
ncbi:unnamed protein product, partial [Durusdinium trenchii]